MVDKTAFTNPFPGLRSYEYEDHSLFFGRDAHISELKVKLLRGKFLALIGSSGSGKSSLIKAGLIPSLENTDGVQEQWQVIVFRPGINPVKNFTAAMKMYMRHKDRSWETRDLEALESEILMDYNCIFPLLEPFKDKKILFVIDQFEEIFRYELTENSRSKSATRNTPFINMLLGLINQQQVSIHVVITMRSDYLDHCTEFKGLTEAINRGYYLLPKMNQEEIREVVTKPVEALGGAISPELVSTLLRKVVDSPDFLPILQHVLMRMWERWKITRAENSMIGLTEFEAIGTLDHSITVHAEEIFTQKLDEKRRLACEKLFKTLVVLGANDTPALHPTTLKEIVKITSIPDYLLIDVVLVFRENGVSFLTPRPGVKIDPDSIIDVSVEKILILWERCRQWLEQELESAKLYKQLSYSALQYQEGKTGLWVNPELQMGLNWRKDNEPTLDWAQRYDPFFERAINFLDYSKNQFEIEARQKEDRQKRELKKARTFATVLGVSSLVSLLFLIVALVLRTQAEQSEKNAQDKATQAQDERLRAEDQTKEAIAQQKIAEQQGVIALLQREMTEKQRLIAEGAEKEALKQKAEADQAKLIAERQKLKADTATTLANQAAASAFAATNDAIFQKNAAEEARREAEVLRIEAFRQQAKAIARFIAIQSFQTPNSNDLAAVLAIKAYQFNINNGGESENPEVFNALSKASSAKATLQAHNDIVRALSENKGTGDLVASGGDDGTVYLWNTTTPAARPVSLRAARQTFKSIRSLAFTPDGKTLFVGTANGQIVRWDKLLENGNQPTKTLIAHDGAVVRLQARTVNGASQLISISSNGQVRVWDISGNQLALLQNVNLPIEISATAVSADNTHIYLGSPAGKVLVFNAENMKDETRELNFVGMRGRLLSIGIPPDEKKIYLGTSDGILYYTTLDRTKGASTEGLTGVQGSHSSGITKIAFSPDGKRLATSCYDWKIRIWNSSDDLSKQQPVVLSDFDNWVLDIRFTGDGKKLIGCGADKTVRMWDINSAVLYSELSKKVTRDLTDDEWTKYVGKDIPRDKLSK